MEDSKVLAILQNRVPAVAVNYCFQLWKNYPFDFKLTKGRQTKVGDFTVKSSSNLPRITLNNDLNPYLFLITYIHEVAHWYVYIKYKDSVDPHGENWKNAFKYLLGPLLREDIFPEQILSVLRIHMNDPKASSFADSKLTSVLREYDENSSLQLILSDLPEGSTFLLHNRCFRKGKLRRTRYLCLELNSKREYLVPMDAIVREAQLNLL